MRRTYFMTALTTCILGTPFLSWAGTCPRNANYLNTTNPAGPLVTLSSLGITSCFYVAANGSDSNSGGSEASPWAHAPGMPNCSGNCKSNAPIGGTGYIFRGGDTWHFGNPRLTPFVGASSWAFTWSGNSQSIPIYIGVDPGWYSGRSWSRPVLSQDNPLSKHAVSHCAYTTNDGNNMIYLPGVSWIVFDDFEITGYCWSVNGQSRYGDEIMFDFWGKSPYAPYYMVIENNYIHGWTHTRRGTQAGGNGWVGNSNYEGSVIQFSAVDGSDSDPASLQPLGQGSDGYLLAYDVFRYFGGTNILDGCHIVHDSLFEHVRSVTDGSTHSDTLYCTGEENRGNQNPNLFYNNVFRYIPDGGEATSMVLGQNIPKHQIDYDFNNVFHDVNNGPNYNVLNDPACSGCGGALTIFNNTAVQGSSTCIFCQGKSAPIVSVNNFFVTTSGERSVYNTVSGVTETSALDASPLALSREGYSSTHDFAPARASSRTVTAKGRNETTGYCADNVLHNVLAEAACTRGATGSCRYDSTKHAVNCPAISAQQRPAKGSWNIGAFQYGTGGQPAPR
jgi:hypothetical protein